MARFGKVVALAKKAAQRRRALAGTDCVLFPLAMVDIPPGATFQVQGAAASITNKVTATLQAGSAGATNVNVTASNLQTQNAQWISDKITLGAPATTYTFTAKFTHNDGTSKDVPVIYKTASNRPFQAKKDEIRFPASSLILPGSTFNVVGFAATTTTRIDAFLLFKGRFPKVQRCKKIRVTFNNKGGGNATWLTAEIPFRLPNTVYTIVVIFHHGARKLAVALARVYQTVAPVRRGKRKRPSRKG